MALAGITCVGEFHYLHHAPGGTPLRRPQRDGRGADRGRRARPGIRITLLDTVLPARRPDPAGHRPLEGAQRRFGDGDADAWADRGRALTRPRRHARIGAAIHSVRAVSAADGCRGLRRAHRGRARPRPPVRAARRERRLPGRARPHPRPGCWPTRGVLGAAHHRRARHPPHRRGHRAARRRRHRRLHVPDHRTRPRRRHRPGRARCDAPAARSAWAATATRSSTCSRRRARSSWTSGCAPAPAATGPPPHCCAPPPRTATPASAGRTAGRSRRARSPTSPRSRWTRRAPPGRCRGSAPRPRCSRPPARTCGTSWSAAGTSSATGSTSWSTTCPRRSPRPSPHCATDADRPTDRAGRRGARAAADGTPTRRHARDEAALRTGHHDDGRHQHRQPGHQRPRTRPGPLGLLDRRGRRHRGRPRRLGRPGEPGAGHRRPRRRRRPGGDPRLRRLPLPPGLRRRPHRRVRRPDGRAARTRRAASAPPSPPPGPPRTPSCDANVARLRRRGAAAGHHHASRSSPATASPSTTRPARCGSPRAAHRRDHLPRRARRRRPSTPTTPAGYVDLVTGPMLDACAPHARWIDVFCERGAFDGDQARADPHRRARPAGWCRGCTPTSSATARACSSPSSSARPPPTTAPT